MAWGDLQWGSCQYDSIADMFNVLTEIADIETACKTLDIKVSYSKVQDFDEIKAIWLKDLIREATDDGVDPDNVSIFDWASQYWDKKIKTLTDATTLDETFTGWCNTSSDLWYALEMTKDLFKDLVIEDNAAGGKLSETLNHHLGVVAYLLVQTGLITDVKYFHGFDT